MADKNKALAWVGWSPMTGPLRASLHADLGISSKLFEDAQSGLDGLEKMSFDLVVLNETVPAGDLFLPEGFSLHDTVGIDCYTIKRIRQITNYGKVPIIVPKINVEKKGYAKPYLEAGATEVIDVWSGKNESGYSRFLESVRRNLQGATG